MKRVRGLMLIVVAYSFWGCGTSGPKVTEERTVFLADPAFLKTYKLQCEQEHGTFCAKEISNDEYVAANLYSNTVTTTEYLLKCTKPKQTPAAKPECVFIK